jgi:hypothetical protein
LYGFRRRAGPHHQQSGDHRDINGEQDAEHPQPARRRRGCRAARNRGEVVGLLLSSLVFGFLQSVEDE